jgi:hypothetical protein
MLPAAKKLPAINTAMIGARMVPSQGGGRRYYDLRTKKSIRIAGNRQISLARTRISLPRLGRASWAVLALPNCPKRCNFAAQITR